MQPVVNVVHVLGKRLYVASTGPSIAAGAGGGFTLTVNGQTGSIWPQVRVNATMGTVRAASAARAASTCTHSERACCSTDLLLHCLPRWQNVTVTLSGPIPFAGAVLTSYQFTNRPGANLYLTTDVATAYNCATQTGALRSVTAGTPTVRANAAWLRRHAGACARLRQHTF